jgi:hypothetical protein
MIILQPMAHIILKAKSAAIIWGMRLEKDKSIIREGIAF